MNVLVATYLVPTSPSGVVTYYQTLASDLMDAGVKFQLVDASHTPTSWRKFLGVLKRLMRASNNAIIALCHSQEVPVIVNQVLQPYKMLQQSFGRQELAIQRLNGLSNMSLVQFLIAAVLTDQKANSVLLGTSNPAYLLHNMESLRYTDNLAEHLPLISKLLA